MSTNKHIPEKQIPTQLYVVLIIFEPKIIKLIISCTSKQQGKNCNCWHGANQAAGSSFLRNHHKATTLEREWQTFRAMEPEC